MARLEILTNDDIKKLYKVPKLNNNERHLIFTLDEKDWSYLSTISTISVKVNYILHLGYFKIAQYFFSFSPLEAKEDIDFIMSTYFHNKISYNHNVSNKQHYKNRISILKKYGMTLCSKAIMGSVVIHLGILAKQHAVGKYIFDSILDYCHKNKIVRPSYSILQKLISATLNKEKERLINKLYRLIDKPLRQSLDSMLEKDDLFYKLTLIKKDQKDFSMKEIKSTIERHCFLSPIYRDTVIIMKNLEISEQNLALYSDLAEQYTIYGLKNLRQRNLARLYLLCYVYCRFLKVNDHLINSFVYKINHYSAAADEYQERSIYAAQIADRTNRELAAKILSLHPNKKIPDHEVRKASFAIVARDKFPHLINNIKKPHMTPDFYRWQYYEQNTVSIKLNIRSTFRTIDFQTSNEDLKNAINFLKRHFDSNNSFDAYGFSAIPIDFIPPSLKRYVIKKIKCDKGRKKKLGINGNCYEFMLYLCIEKNLQKGVISVRDSLFYKTLDDELISIKEWEEEKVDILKKISPFIVTNDIEEMLSHFECLMVNRYEEVNHKINSGMSDKIKIKYNKKGEIIKWHLPYKKKEDQVNNTFYDNLGSYDIEQIMKFVNHKTDFVKHFSHILPSYSKTKASEDSIAACLLAKGTGIDLYRMKDISDIKEQELLSTYNNFIRYQTLNLASDAVVNELDNLVIFGQYNLSDYGVHASVDGQKLEVKYNTVKARYSAKYYGLGKGVSAYTLFANCAPLCTKIISSNEHESHYLLDILKSNSSDVGISKVSGDMHSINRVNFIILHIFGYRFMPRFVKLDKKANKHLVSFDIPEAKKYQKYIIKPHKKVNRDLIIKEADNLLRIFATLAIKKSTQSSLIRKLSSYKTNDTLKALIELDKIIMSLYILDYVEDEEMRQNVHRSLNRVESYHQLRSAIAKVGGKKLVGQNETELIINNECARLLAICIIFYNASLLSGIYEYCRSKEMWAECRKVIRLSPVAWQHISLIGKYAFRSNVEILDIQKVISSALHNL